MELQPRRALRAEAQCFRFMVTRLHNIVAVLVLDQAINIYKDLVENSKLLGVAAMLQYPLNHSTPIGVRREFLHLPHEGVDHELELLTAQYFDALLNHMIAVLGGIERVGVE